MRLYGFINVFNQEPTFLQPVFCQNDKNNKQIYFFQHSENKTTISSFENADLEYYEEYSSIIVLPQKDIKVQIGSTVVFAIYIDKKVFWGDYVDIQNFFVSHPKIQKTYINYPGFLNTSKHFVDEYKNKKVEDLELPRSLRQEIRSSLFYFCTSTETDESRFVDLYFCNKQVPKFWTIPVVGDLIFSLSRIRRSEEYVRSLVNGILHLDLSQPLIPFRERLTSLSDVHADDFFPSIDFLFEDIGIRDLYVIDCIKSTSSYILVAENYRNKSKRFLLLKTVNVEGIRTKLIGLIEELASETTDKLHLIINSLIIEECLTRYGSNCLDPSKVQLIEFPIGAVVEYS